MSGFTGLIAFKDSILTESNKIKFPDYANRFYPKLESICGQSYCFFYYGNRRLYQAPLIRSSLSNIFGLEGVFLNKQIEELERKIEIDRGELQPPVEFLNTLKTTHGSFSGFNYNKSSQELFLFTDQTSSRQIFYYSGNDLFAFSSSIFLLCDLLRQLKIKPTLNEPASYMILSLGYFIKDYTLVNEIKKLEAGKYLIVNAKSTIIKEYHNYFMPVLHNKITRDLIDELDTRFRRSIEMEYQYDLNKGLKHIATLSGGLDSRMNLMVAWENGFKEITALTFSEGMHPDELVARKISNDLKIEHIIIPLNNGLHLFDIDTPLLLNNCAVYYFGAPQTLTAVRKLNFNNFGLLHNGNLAESSKGSYLSVPEHIYPQLSKRSSVSDKLFDRVQSLFKNEIAGSYPNEEMFGHYSRAFNAAHNGSWMTRPFAESVYTFMEPNFAELAYSISPKLRYNSFLTIEWLLTLHPKWADYNWATKGIPPTNNPGKKIIYRLISKLGRMISGNDPSPFPLNRWFESNDRLRKFVNENYNNSNAWSIIPVEIKKDVDMLFRTGTINEKMLCLSYLKSLDLLFLIMN